MITLRKAREQDLPVIADIAERTWPVTYGGIISSEQLRYMLDRMYSHVELLSQLEKGHTFLILSNDMVDIGFAGFSVDENEGNVYKLHKLYVIPDAQGGGFGKFLINEVVDQVRKAGGAYLQLNVNRANKAKDFYERMGFMVKETVDIDIGNGFYMNDYVMEIAL